MQDDTDYRRREASTSKPKWTAIFFTSIKSILIVIRQNNTDFDNQKNAEHQISTIPNLTYLSTEVLLSCIIIMSDEENKNTHTTLKEVAELYKDGVWTTKLV